MDRRPTTAIPRKPIGAPKSAMCAEHRSRRWLHRRSRLFSTLAEKFDRQNEHWLGAFDMMNGKRMERIGQGAKEAPARRGRRLGGAHPETATTAREVGP
jgi:hypothetical protein